MNSEKDIERHNERLELLSIVDMMYQAYYQTYQQIGLESIEYLNAKIGSIKRAINKAYGGE